MKPNLKVINNTLKDNSITDIIGRDASQKLKLNPPTFEYEPVNMYKEGLKWLNSLVKYDKGVF